MFLVNCSLASLMPIVIWIFAWIDSVDYFLQQARYSDELTITEGEILDVIDWDDGEGWTKVNARSDALHGID